MKTKAPTAAEAKKMHAFYVTKYGALHRGRRHCEPHYMATP